APQSEDRPVFHAGRDLHRQVAAPVLRSGAPAVGARVGDDPARAAALGARRAEREEALVLGDHAPPAAGGAGRDRGAGLRPRPVAAGAGAGAVDGDLGGESVGGVLEADAQIGLDVRPALGAARPATEAEDVTEPEPA